MIKKQKNKSFIKELTDYLGIEKGREKSWTEVFDGVREYFSTQKGAYPYLDKPLGPYETNYHERLDILCGIERPEKQNKLEKGNMFSRSLKVTAKGFDIYSGKQKENKYSGFQNFGI